MRLHKRMIQHIYLLFAIFLTLPLHGSGSALAEGSATAQIYIAADHQSYPLNDTIKLTVLTRGVHDLYAVKWDITYDDQCVSYMDGSAKSISWTNGYLRTKAAPGLIRQISSKLGDEPGDSGDFALLTLHFKPKQEGDTILRLDQLGASDSALQLMAPIGNSELRVRITPPDHKPPAEVSHAKSKEEHNQAMLTWDDPNDGDLTDVRIYLDGELNTSADKGLEHALITGLTPKTEYRFVIKTVDRVGNESAGVTIKANTKKDSPGKDK